MREYPKISIVTVTYNCMDTVEQTICNVLKQTYPNIEYIIIDGASTDGTKEIIEKYADRLAYWISEPDKGIYDAMNKGIKAATGEWILFRNSGDYFFKPTTVEDVFKWYEDHGEGIITGGKRVFEHNGYFDAYPNTTPSEKYWDKARFSHPATFIRCQLQKRNPFPENLKIAGDFYFFCTMMKAGCRSICYPHIIALFDGETGFSAQNRQQSFKEILYVIQSLGASPEDLLQLKKKYRRASRLCVLLKYIKRIGLLNRLYRKAKYPNWTFMPKKEILSNI